MKKEKSPMGFEEWKKNLLKLEFETLSSASDWICLEMGERGLNIKSVDV